MKTRYLGMIIALAACAGRTDEVAGGPNPASPVGGGGRSPHLSIDEVAGGPNPASPVGGGGRSPHLSIDGAAREKGTPVAPVHVAQPPFQLSLDGPARTAPGIAYELRAHVQGAAAAQGVTLRLVPHHALVVASGDDSWVLVPTVGDGDEVAAGGPDPASPGGGGGRSPHPWIDVEVVAELHGTGFGATAVATFPPVPEARSPKAVDLPAPVRMSGGTLDKTIPIAP